MAVQGKGCPLARVSRLFANSPDQRRKREGARPTCPASMDASGLNGCQEGSSRRAVYWAGWQVRNVFPCSGKARSGWVNTPLWNQTGAI